MRWRHWMPLALLVCALSNAANVTLALALGWPRNAALPALAGAGCLVMAAWGLRLARREAELDRQREERDARWLREQQQ